MDMHYVYRLTCHHPDRPAKYYYGYHRCPPTTDPRRDGYWSSSRPVRAAISTYGLAFFTKKVIAVYATKAKIAEANRCRVVSDATKAKKARPARFHQ